jgi:predicted RNA-binding Zn-ribbon protein involved in translation (DUF1610 family)
MKKLEKVYRKNNRTYSKFLCNCGNTVILRDDSTSKSCRLPNCTESNIRRNQQSKSRLYLIWDGIKARCIYKHNSNIHYKDKGISIDPSWLEFSNFRNWSIKNGYMDTLTIDRIDINKGYSPDNCEWVTRSENTRRQIKDYHGNQKKVSILKPNSNLWISFKSIRDSAKYIQSTYLTEHNLKTIEVGLNSRLNGKYKTPYLGIQIKYD